MSKAALYVEYETAHQSFNVWNALNDATLTDSRYQGATACQAFLMFEADEETKKMEPDRKEK